MKVDETKYFEMRKEITRLKTKLKAANAHIAFLKKKIEELETKALFKEEGFPERIVNSVPKLIKRVDRIRPALDRLGEN